MDDLNPAVRHKAVETIGRLVAERRGSGLEAGQAVDVAKVIDPLSKALLDDSRSVRKAAVAALGPIGGSQVIELLADVMADEYFDLREQVAVALGETHDAHAIGLLSVLLNDFDYRVRSAAVSALGRIGGSTVLNGLLSAASDSHFEVRTAAATALGVVVDHDRAIGALASALKGDKRREVRVAAAHALGRAGGSHAIALLGEALLSGLAHGHLRAVSNGCAETRKAAAAALGDTGSRNALPALRSCLLVERDPAVKSAVKIAIASIENVTADTAGRPRTTSAADPLTDSRLRAATDAVTADGRPRP
jgi:HEAT repeat protein